MNLSSPTKKNLFSKKFDGTKVYVGEVLYKPIRIDRFEIVPSVRNKGKMMLACQIMINGEPRLLMTESYSLIRDITGTEESLPHYTKIIRKKREAYYYFAPLNEMEIHSITGTA